MNDINPENHSQDASCRAKHEEAMMLTKTVHGVKSTLASASTTLPAKTTVKNKKNRVFLNQISSHNIKVQMTLSRQQQLLQQPEQEVDLEPTGMYRFLRRRGYNASDTESNKVSSMNEKNQPSHHSHESQQLSSTCSLCDLYSLNLNQSTNLLVDD